MRDPGCLIIDDVDAALSTMSDFGRSVLVESCHRVRDAVLKFAARRQWTVVPYRQYVQWAHEIMSREDHPWLVLDPLFPPGHIGERLHFVRMTRGSRGLDGGARDAMDVVLESLSHTQVGVLDDAAASGTTLRYVAGRIVQAGRRLERILVCASRRMARESLLGGLRSARWAEYVPQDDWRIAHLRDGCAYLPYTGRRADQQPVLASDGSPVELRLPATTATGSLWQVLNIDAATKAAVSFQRSRIPQALSGFLERPALVEDLPLLGPGVPAPVIAGQQVGAKTTLGSLTTEV